MRTIQYLITALTLCSASILATSQATAQCPNCPTEPKAVCPAGGCPTAPQASCPTGVCPSEGPGSLSSVGCPEMAVYGGQPVRRAGGAAVGVVRVTAKTTVRVVTAPVRFFRNHKPVRKVLRCAGRIATGRGLILGRIRGNRGC